MKFVKKIPLWLLSGILYGLSWPIFETVNLSFLAWFAFVPLFIFLEKNKNAFLKNMIGSYAAMVIFGCFSAFWLFNFPQTKLQIAVIFFLEELWFFIPFLIFYPIQRKIGFDKALWLFPFIWMLWEWIYLSIEFTMGTHLSAYSQSSNLWLIQYVDITGMWGISFWLMLFNVLLFKTFKKFNYTFCTKFYKKASIISFFMIIIPLIYGAFSYYKFNNIKGKTINITIVPTQFSVRYLSNSNNHYSVVEQTLKNTDAFASTMKDKNLYSDLYVWPETGIPFTMKESNLSNLLFEAVTDWKAALITGARGISDTTNISDHRMYVSGVLISYKNKELLYHHKTVLTPGQEAIPYHSLLVKIPKFPIAENDTRYYRKGKTSKPLKLITKTNNEFWVGVSLCYEQWYPNHWTALARNGAEFYTHLAGEGWYGTIGFKRFMANVTRLRTIENRKQTARSANVGISNFIDQMGRFKTISNNKSFQPINSTVTALKNITFYAKYPNWFPIIGFSIFFIITFYQFYYIHFTKLLN